MFEYDTSSQQAAEYLDSLDLKARLIQCWEMGKTEVHDLKQSLVALTFEPTEKEALEVALEELTADEFLDYLYERYKIRYYEEITYHIYKPPIKTN